MTVGRTEIVDTIGALMYGRPVSRADLISSAMRRRAHPEVIDTLRRLPDRSFSDVRRLWEFLPDVLVEA